MQMDRPSVRDVVQNIANAHRGKRSNFDISINEYSDHYRINTNALTEFEVELLQSGLDDEGYTSYRFNKSGNYFLKVPLDS